MARLANPREHLAATSDGSGATFLLGGRLSGLDGNLALADLVEGGSSTTIGELPTPRGGVAAFWWPTLGACLVGGESPGGTNAQVECIDEDGDVSVFCPFSAQPRHGLGAAVVDGVAYVALGGDQPGLFVSPTVESSGAAVAITLREGASIQRPSADASNEAETSPEPVNRITAGCRIRGRVRAVEPVPRNRRFSRSFRLNGSSWGVGSEELPHPPAEAQRYAITGCHASQ